MLSHAAPCGSRPVASNVLRPVNSPGGGRQRLARDGKPAQLSCACEPGRRRRKVRSVTDGPLKIAPRALDPVAEVSAGDLFPDVLSTQQVPVVGLAIDSRRRAKLLPIQSRRFGHITCDSLL